MPAAKASMRKIREVLRLRYGDPPLSHRDIGVSCNLSPSTVGDTLQRFRLSGLPWPLPEELDDQALEASLYVTEPRKPDAEPPPPEPDWAEVHRELGHKGVTLALLWKEYREGSQAGYGYSWFCQNYRQWADRIKVVMRQPHKFGEKVFVDYAGHTVPVVDVSTGEVRFAQVFVGVLGGSNYTYAEASWSQDLPSWVTAHVRMFAFFGGVPEVAVPDNLKSGVTKACYYEPDLNPTYHEMAKHYQIAVIPARKGRPRDKAKVEQAVQLVERWVLAALRKRTFYSLEELNQAISELLEWLNKRPFKKLPGSRLERFEQDEKPALRPLPAEPYEYGEWKSSRVNLDYHVEVDGHYYSVPHQLARQVVEVRLTATTVQMVHQSVRVASHKRSFRRGMHTTIPEHMPSHHRFRADWTRERVLAWAGKSGDSVRQVADAIMAGRMHPEQGFRACMGLISLGKRFGTSRLEAACARAVEAKAFTYQSIKSILHRGLDRQPLASRTVVRSAGYHANVRGPGYYQPNFNFEEAN